MTGDYQATASHQQALKLFHNLGQPLCQAEAQNNLGELATWSTDTRHARHRHAQALAIARDLGVPLEEACVLEGIGNSYRQDGNPSEAAAYLQQALVIYQRIGSPYARRVQEALHRSGL